MQSLLLYTPLILANMWHAYLVFRIRPQLKDANSISESALVSKRTLLIHQIIHSTLGISFITFAVISINTVGFSYAVGLLIIAAVLDVLQAVILHKDTDHTPFRLTDTHQALAWLMTFAYIAFTILYSVEESVPSIFLYAFILVLIVGGVYNYVTKHKHFWVMQMTLFMSTTILVFVGGLV